MPRLSRIKDALGRLGGKDPGTLAQTATAAAPIEAETTIITDTTGTFSQMTPEQITARNRAILAQVSHNPPAHEHFMEFCKSTWRIVGPIAFIVFTAGEVYVAAEGKISDRARRRDCHAFAAYGAANAFIAA